MPQSIVDYYNQWSRAQDLQRGTLELVCQRVVDETPDTKTFVLTTEPATRFLFKPGQFITLQLEIDGEPVQRSYTIGSSPSRPCTLELTIRRVQGGKASGWILDNITPGSRIRAVGPDGGFNIIDLPAKKLLMMSASCGVTPVMSMSRWLLDTGADVDIHFVHSAATEADLVYRRELVYLAEQHDNFKLDFTVDNRDGMLNQELLQRLVPDLHSRSVYICGAPGYMNAVEAMVANTGFDMANYHYEKFTADLLDSEQAAAPVVDAAEQASYAVALEKSGVSVEVSASELLVDTLLNNKAPVVAACRSGMCGACKVQIVDGEVDSTSQMTLTPEEIEQGYVLSCCSRPKTDIRVAI